MMSKKQAKLHKTFEETTLLILNPWDTVFLDFATFFKRNVKIRMNFSQNVKKKNYLTKK